jgi:hypothetical protein
MRWKDKSDEGRASQLEIVDEFRSFVKPTWRPQLSQYCTNLTGITQVRLVLLFPRFRVMTTLGSSRFCANISGGLEEVCPFSGQAWLDQFREWETHTTFLLVQ